MISIRIAMDKFNIPPVRRNQIYVVSWADAISLAYDFVKEEENKKTRSN